MIFDSHMHTHFSADSSMKIEDALKTAKNRGIGIITTEHVDINTDNPWTVDMQAYFDSYYPLKEKENYLIGLEIGMDDRYLEDIKKYIDFGPLDFILGSVHTIYDEYVGIPEFYENSDRVSLYKRYIRHATICVKNHNFINALSHIDYIARYCNYEDKSFKYTDFKDELDELFKTVAEKEIALELNLVRFRDENIEEFRQNYQAFKDNGGKYVTIGSDSHGHERVGQNIEKAIKLIEEIGLNIVHFKDRKMIIDK